MADYWHKTWMCPYFRWDEKKKVACEGGCIVVFPDVPAALHYMEAHCANIQGYHRCTIAAALTDYYERMDRIEKSR